VNIIAVRSGGLGGGTPRDTLFLQTGSVVNRNLYATLVDSVLLVGNVGGSVIDNASQEGTTPDCTIADVVGLDVVFSGPATGSAFGLFPFGPGTGVINRNLTVNTAAGGSSFVGLATGSVLRGNGSILTGAGADFVDLGGEVDGSMTVSTGDGDDVVSLDAGAVVQGNLQISGGNGNNSLTVNGTVGGNLGFTQGNGNNTATVTQAPGGTLNWTSGNGNCSLTLGDSTTPAGSNWRVNVRFGNGDDTFTLDASAPAPQSISGYVDGGGQITADVFNQGANWTIGGPFTLVNFP
jgi:hypothetical protein